MRNRKCSYNEKLNSYKSTETIDEVIPNKDPPLDIEDLVNIGQTHKICPFFGSRLLEKEAEILFIPYNYLLDPRILKQKKSNKMLSGNILLLDEAHNLEKFCLDSASFNMTTTMLVMVIAELQIFLDIIQGEATTKISSFSPSSVLNRSDDDNRNLFKEKEEDEIISDEALCKSLTNLLEKLVNLERLLSLMKIDEATDASAHASRNKTYSATPSRQMKNGGWILDILEEMDIREDVVEEVNEIISKSHSLLSTQKNNSLTSL